MLQFFRFYTHIKKQATTKATEPLYVCKRVSEKKPRKKTTNGNNSSAFGSESNKQIINHSDNRRNRKCFLTMVCKEDVVHWFKGLESYKRIDAMCTLLNMCLPFELRFLGTCLEELGGQYSKEFRGIELRVNNSSELTQELASTQLCDPSDTKVRRKMALYFALIRACNRPCVNELFNILCTWSGNEFLKQAKGDALQELLLVYTMAANHPVFSFQQKMRCGDIYNEILKQHPESSFIDVPVENMHVKHEGNPSTSATFALSQKHVPSEQIMPVYAIPNPVANVTQVAFDQNRGSQVNCCDENIVFHI